MLSFLLKPCCGAAMAVRCCWQAAAMQGAAACRPADSQSHQTSNNQMCTAGGGHGSPPGSAGQADTATSGGQAAPAASEAGEPRWYAPDTPPVKPDFTADVSSLLETFDHLGMLKPDASSMLGSFDLLGQFGETGAPVQATQPEPQQTETLPPDTDAAPGPLDRLFILGRAGDNDTWQQYPAEEDLGMAWRSGRCLTVGMTTLYLLDPYTGQITLVESVWSSMQGHVKGIQDVLDLWARCGKINP